MMMNPESISRVVKQLRSKENQITPDAKSEEDDGLRPQKKQSRQRKLVKDKVGT